MRLHSQVTPKCVHALWDDYLCHNGLQLAQIISNGCFWSYSQGGVYSQAIKKVVVVKSKEQQLREACSYTFDLFNAGCGSGCSLEGEYLCETLEGKVIWHRVALNPDVTDIGARTQTVFHCSVVLPYFIC